MRRQHGLWRPERSSGQCAFVPRHEEAPITHSVFAPARAVSVKLRYGIARNRILIVSHLLQQLVLVLIALTLPAQGLMAATMPLCEHQTGETQHQSQDERHDAHAHANPLEHASPHEHAKDPGTSGVQCHDCASCQVCASPGLTGFIQIIQATVAVSPRSDPAAKISPFFPELFQRPPLALAA